MLSSATGQREKQTVLKRNHIAVLYGDAGTEEDGLAFLDKVFESGCRFWDTAEVR